MTRLIRRLRAGGEAGMATVEYALVTVAAAALAAVLIAVIKSPEIRSGIAGIIGGALTGA